MWLLTVSVILIYTLVDVQGAVVECSKLTNRSEWKAAAPKRITPFAGKPSVVLIKETGETEFYCAKIIKKEQERDMIKHHSDDIDCSFMIGFFGDLCEGRGWSSSVIGNKALVLCVCGRFQNRAPPKNVENNIRSFLSCQASHLDPEYEIITLRDTNPLSLNPGHHLYSFIQTLPHYKKRSETEEFNAVHKLEHSVWHHG